MKWNIKNIDDKLKTGVYEFLKYWNIESGTDGLNIYVKKGISLSATSKDSGYEITYQDDAGLFRALALLRGCIADGEKDIRICEYKQFDTCGIMIDCSRNSVLKIEKLKEILLKIACIGMNRCMLYTEDTYKIQGYPYFGYMRGAYTQQELKELDNYAAALGIELVPCIQTLGHLRQGLRWPYADAIKDTDDILLIGCEETYQLIEEMFKTFRSCFRSKNIHIGMDEAHGVGLGKYLNINGYKERIYILTEHLKRVADIAKKYGYSPMMWGDMFFRLCTDNGNYYDGNFKLPKEIRENMPENIDLVYWDYYNDNEAVYDKMFAKHSAIGGKISFAGGVWKWAGTSVCYGKTFKTTHPALKSAYKFGVKDVIATIWGDDGSEIPFDTTWLGIQLYGEYNYYKEVSDEHLQKRFKQCLDYDVEQFMVLEVDDYPEKWCHNGESLEFSKCVLYQDILCGLFDKNIISIPIKAHYQKHLEHLKNIPVPYGLDKLYSYQKKLLEVLILKCDMGIRISDAYKQYDKKELQKCIYDLNTLTNLVSDLQIERTVVWKEENKIFGMDRIDLRFGGLLSRINTAKKRLCDYINGDCETIEELEAVKLMFGGDAVREGKSLISTNMYNLIATVSSEGAI